MDSWFRFDPEKFQKELKDKEMKKHRGNFIDGIFTDDPVMASLKNKNGAVHEPKSMGKR